MTENKAVRLARYPRGVPVPEDFTTATEHVGVPGDGQMLCRSLVLSLDPYVRVMMLAPESHVPSKTHGRIEIGETVPGRVICEVTSSRLDGYSAGDLVVTNTGWQEFALSDGTDVRRIRHSPLVPLEAHLGVLGMTGFTAYAGLRFVGQPKAGETVLVSAASGAVGSIVGQLARFGGSEAVGIAGDPEKCRYVEEELKFTRCVSRYSDSVGDELRAACPNGVDVYFDNVGGDLLDSVLPLLNDGARIVVCGRISDLNETAAAQQFDRRGIFLGYVLTRMLTVKGFVWGQYAAHFDEFVDEMEALISSGRIHYRSDVVQGLDQAPAAFARLFDGTNFGKLLVQVTPPAGVS